MNKIRTKRNFKNKIKTYSRNPLQFVIPPSVQSLWKQGHSKLDTNRTPLVPTVNSQHLIHSSYHPLTSSFPQELHMPFSSTQFYNTLQFQEQSMSTG